MDMLSNLWLGLSVAVTPINLWWCLVGCFLGTAIGVLPGLGPTATIAMLLPATFALEPVSALIMMAGIFYGAQYGGSTTAILVNLPGEVTSVVTALDGYKMARQGAAGRALAAAAISSFFAGTVCTVLIAMFAPPLADIAGKFGPAEYFSLMVLGLVAAVVLANGSVFHALAMIVVGLFLGTVGTDVTSGTQRYAFGRPDLADGLNFVIVAMGVFGIAEIIANLEESGDAEVEIAPVQGLMPTREDWIRMIPSTLRGTTIGALLGVLPGAGGAMASFAAYAAEKKLSKYGDKLGTGVIEGIASPEAANNAGAQMSFVPMLTLGLPANPVMALMIGAMIVKNIVPGPTVMTAEPALFWGLIASMWVGNAMLLALNLPLIGIWVRMIQVPYRYLFPMIAVFCAIGVFSLSNTVFDLYVMVAFGLFGYVLKKLGCEPAPMLFGFVLGAAMEEYLRRTLLISHGDPSVLVTRPISAALLGLSVLCLALILLPAFRKSREEAA